MRQVLDALHVSQTDAAVLAAVNLADELLKNQAAAENLQPPGEKLSGRGHPGQERGLGAEAPAVQGPAGPGPMMELLSPAGGWEAMVAAVQNGADAVYMGFGGSTPGAAPGISRTRNSVPPWPTAICGG